MQRMERTKGLATGSGKTGGEERKRVEAVVETLAMVGSRGETLAEVTHDVRNMVTALGLYCDLLEEPGVLNAPFSHYAGELRLVAAASRRLVEKMVALDAHASAVSALPMIEDEEQEPTLWSGGFPGNLLTERKELKQSTSAKGWEAGPAGMIRNLAAELLANRNLLAALAGPGVALTVDTRGGSQPVRLTAEDLTRILVNLVKNASEAMKGSGRVQIVLGELSTADTSTRNLQLTLEDNGPGISATAFEKVFESGFTTHSAESAKDSWTSTHRGLGLAITRSIIEAAGGKITASNRTPQGARIEILLPVEGTTR